MAKYIFLSSDIESFRRWKCLEEAFLEHPTKGQAKLEISSESLKCGELESEKKSDKTVYGERIMAGLLRFELETKKISCETFIENENFCGLIQ